MNIRDLPNSSAHTPQSRTRRQEHSQRQPLHLPAAQARAHIRRHAPRGAHGLVVDRPPEQRLCAFGQAAVIVRDGPLEVRLEPVWEPPDEVFGAAEVRGLADALVVCGARGVAQRDVIADLREGWLARCCRRGKDAYGEGEVREVLEEDGAGVAQVGELERADVLAVEEDLAVLRLVQTRDQLEDGALAGTIRAHNHLKELLS